MIVPILEGESLAAVVDWVRKVSRELDDQRPEDVTPIIPIGTLKVADAAPPGWVVVTGQTLRKSAFPELYAVIGDAYANEVELPVVFRLPNPGEAPAGKFWIMRAK